MRWQPGQRWCKPLPGGKLGQAKAAPALAEHWPLESPTLCLLAAVPQSRACGTFAQEGTLEEKANNLISQVRKLRPREALGESEDTQSEALLLCSFGAPSRDRVWL